MERQENGQFCLQSNIQHCCHLPDIYAPPLFKYLSFYFGIYTSLMQPVPDR